MARAGCFSGGQSSVKLYSTCLLLVGAGFPPCWLFGLRRPNTGASKVSLVRLMATLGGLKPRSTSQNFCCQCPCPHRETQPHPASEGDPPTLADRSGSVSPWVTAPSTTLCVPSKSAVSVSPSPVKVLQSNPASLQSLIL